MSLISIVNLDSLKPAPYNPRLLTDDAFENLKKSITTLGIIKPIVIRDTDRLIIAGHQRTRTMKYLGIKEAPAFIVHNVGTTDEVRFNQLHNFTEVEIIEEAPKICLNIPSNARGFVEVKPENVIIQNKGKQGAKVLALSRMIEKHGQFASVVCDNKGVVIVSSVYALAVKLKRLPVLAYVLDENKVKDCVFYFSKEYGKFNYDNIERHTYMQTLAQKPRLRRSSKDKSKMAKNCHSRLYESCVIPYITKDMRVLDFGAGMMDYAKMLNARGYNITALEFYRREEKTSMLDIVAVRRDFEDLCNKILKYGLFDVVVCDSVLNSVDCKEAEISVMRTLSALCKPNGKIFVSGIGVHAVEEKGNADTKTDVRNTGVYMDENKFTANYRLGEWYFQHYHNLQDIYEVGQIAGSVEQIWDCGKLKTNNRDKLGTSWQARVLNEKRYTIDEKNAALDFEFSLPLPSGKRYDFAEKIKKILSEFV